ncbi:hypothetical protein BBJ28_00005775 [Nothophytophthora sp. Chile5]|nr:hypothetical protein BBJ28_00005775 [Nothophytophthora sp. Chile5]
MQNRVGHTTKCEFNSVLNRSSILVAGKRKWRLIGGLIGEQVLDDDNPHDALAAQRLKIMKAKAARLEIKHQQQAIRAKEVAREKAIHDEKVRQYFEEKVEVRKERNAEVERRRETLLATLRQQSAKWTTEQNYAEKLKEDVFIYSPQQISTRNSFDPSSSSGSSAVSWLEKLQRMKPVGVENDEEEEAVASAVAAAADEDDAAGSTTEDSSDEEDTPNSTEEETEPTKKE